MGSDAKLAFLRYISLEKNAEINLRNVARDSAEERGRATKHGTAKTHDASAARKLGAIHLYNILLTSR
jgi:hypothetical protein